MSEEILAQEEEPTWLSDVEVLSLGLVPSGANRQPFFLLKSEDPMDEIVVQELEEVKDVNRGAWDKLVGVLKAALAPPEPELVEVEKAKAATVKAVQGALNILQAHKDDLPTSLLEQLEKLAGGYGYPPEKSAEKKGAKEEEEKPEYGYPPEEKKGGKKKVEKSDQTADESVTQDFADLQARLQAAEQRASEFAEKLGAMQKDAEATSVALATERDQRRLMEFTDRASTEFDAIPGKADELGAFMKWVYDADSSEGKTHFNFLEDTLKKSQAVFAETYSEIGTSRSTEPGSEFEKLIEQRTKAIQANGVTNFADAYAQALKAVSAEQPALADSYIRGRRHDIRNG